MGNLQNQFGKNTLVPPSLATTATWAGCLPQYSHLGFSFNGGWRILFFLEAYAR